MRLHGTAAAPNAVRVRVVMREKGIQAELVDVTPESRNAYLSINPLGQVPALKLDDGLIITESLTICQYLDDVSGSPKLFGETALDRARIGMWERRAEMMLFIPSIEYGHHTHPMFQGRLTQHPDWARELLPKAGRMIELMGDQLDANSFLAGDEFTAADITAYLGYFALVAFGGITPTDRASVRSWATRVGTRDCMEDQRRLAVAFGMPPTL
jgi:glutathione S-transferase